MKLNVKLQKLIIEHGLNNLISEMIDIEELDKLILMFANQCIYKANFQKNHKREKMWYRLARIFHRAYDELNIEKDKKAMFKVARKDIYECQKCKRRFKVDAGNEENCKFIMEKSAIVVTCPGCGKSE